MPNAADARTARRQRRPLTAHRWFPAMVALWFAALFGLCALAVPTALLERLVDALGIDRVLPVAAPPLSDTARLLIAAGLSSIGEIVGLLLGRALGARHRPKPEKPEDANEPCEERTFPGAPRKPLSAHEDLAGWDEAPEPIVEPATEPEPPARSPVLTEDSATPNIASAPLESLGVVQLSERLALAMRTNREPPRAAPPEIAQALEAARASLRRSSGAR